MKPKKSILIYMVILLGIGVLVNLFANRFFFRLDFTEDKSYTLSEATRDILDDLDHPVTVTAYFSEGLPPNISRTRQEFKNLLIEYSNRSDGNIVYEFIHPNADDQTEQEALQNGISPVVINVREKDQSVQKKAYLGAVLKYADQTEIIPFIQPGEAMEYLLSSGIKKLATTNKAVIGFIQGHGEPTTSMFSQAMASLEVLYRVEGVNLTDSTYLPKYKTLVLVAPTDSLPEAHLAMLDDYLANGGNMVLALNRVEGDLTQARGYEVTTGLERWLAEKGVSVEGSFVVDENCGSIGVRQQQGAFSFTTQLSFPYLPVASGFAEHPVTEGLEQVVFQFVSPLTYTGDTTLHFKPLVFSSTRSGTQMAPLYFQIQKSWGDSDFRLSQIPLAGVLEGKISGDNRARIIVFGDGDFAVNGTRNQSQQLQPDNVNLLVNSIDWLSDDTGLIELRTKGVTSRPLKQLEDGTKTLIKWLNFLVPILLIILYGLFRMNRNRRIREKRRNENYNR
jgi:gliding-associated putative ABC transporter substrate-binding component GldG